MPVLDIEIDDMSAAETELVEFAEWLAADERTDLDRAPVRIMKFGSAIGADTTRVTNAFIMWVSPEEPPADEVNGDNNNEDEDDDEGITDLSDEDLIPDDGDDDGDDTDTDSDDSDEDLSSAIEDLREDDVAEW